MSGFGTDIPHSYVPVAVAYRLENLRDSDAEAAYIMTPRRSPADIARAIKAELGYSRAEADDITIVGIIGRRRDSAFIAPPFVERNDVVYYTATPEQMAAEFPELLPPAAPPGPAGEAAPAAGGRNSWSRYVTAEYHAARDAGVDVTFKEMLQLLKRR